jgi:hypothetical protein
MKSSLENLLEITSFLQDKSNSKKYPLLYERFSVIYDFIGYVVGEGVFTAFADQNSNFWSMRNDIRLCFISLNEKALANMLEDIIKKYDFEKFFKNEEAEHFIEFVDFQNAIVKYQDRIWKKMNCELRKCIKCNRLR